MTDHLSHEIERDRLLAALEHYTNAHMTFMRHWAYQWAALLPTPEAREAASAAIADATTPRDLKRILEG